MPTCRVWPDGTFGFSVIDRKLQMEAFEPKRERTGHEDFIAAQIEVYGVEAVIEACVKTKEWRRNLEELEGEERPDSMDLTTVSNSPKAKRGQNGISTYGRLLVKNACWLMERAHPIDTITFLTTTLPPMDVMSNRYVVEHWADVVKFFVKKLGRRLQGAGLSGEIVGVTEVQEGRFSANADFIGLHLHLLFVGRKPYSHWVITLAEVEEFWKAALGSVSQRVAERCDFSRSTNLQRLKSSGAAYIGKYLSKGVKTITKIKVKNPGVTLPPCWYTCTLSLRHKVKGLQVVGRKPSLKLGDWIGQGQTEYFDTLRTITATDEDGKEFLIGWAGRLSEKGRNALSLPFTPNGLPRQKRLFPDGL